MMRPLDLSGQQFGRLTAVSLAGHLGRERAWSCRCDCGENTVVATNSLRSGNARSCGCLERELRIDRLTTHNGVGTRLYDIWMHMRQRCSNPNGEFHHRYGGRGIKVCDEWREDFAAFRDWALANGYRDDLTIDRWPNNDGNYEPKNCRWATAKEQANNR